MFCPNCGSFLSPSESKCRFCGVSLKNNNVSKKINSPKSKNKNSAAKNVKKSKNNVSKKNKKSKPKKKNKKSKPRKKNKKSNIKSPKPSAKHSMLQAINEYNKKNPTKRKSKKKKNKSKNKTTNSKKKNRKKRKIKPLKTNTTIKSKTGRIEYNNGYPIIEGASRNGKKMRKGSFKKKFNGEGKGFAKAFKILGGKSVNLN